MELFIIFAFHGIVAGIVYLTFCIIRRLTNYNQIASIPLDIITGLLVGLILFRCVAVHTKGEVRLYFVLAFLLGIITTLITFKNFVATLSDFVYNNIRKAIIRKKVAHQRRKQDGRAKTSKNC